MAQAGVFLHFCRQSFCQIAGMSAVKMGRKWADVDEEDDEDTLVADGKNQGSRFETPVDENGVKTVVEYTERDGKTYKVSRKVRETRMSSWTNKYIQARKSMTPFGKAESIGPEANAILTVKSVEEVNFDLVKTQSTSHCQG